MQPIACPQPVRAASVRQSTSSVVSSRQQRAQSARTNRFTPTVTAYKVKRCNSPYAANHNGRPASRRSRRPIKWKRVFVISALAVLLTLLIIGIVLIVPKRPTLFLKRVSVPSSSSYSISSSGQSITVAGLGVVSGRLHNPNFFLKQTIKDVSIDVFWVGYQGDDSDYFDTPPLATGQLSKKFITLYPRDTVDINIQTAFNHTGIHNVDPIWIDFIRRCLNQDDESRRLRLLFRTSAVVGSGWWGERRRRYLAPQDLPCPLTPSQIIALFKDMQLAPPEQSQIN